MILGGNQRILTLGWGGEGLSRHRSENSHHRTLEEGAGWPLGVVQMLLEAGWVGGSAVEGKQNPAVNLDHW